MVLMLVFASIVPGAVHSAATADSVVVSSGAHHAGDRSSVDHSMVGHHQAGGDHTGPGHSTQPAGFDDVMDRCCPVSCSIALCSFEPESAAVFVPDSFEHEPFPAFVVVVVAMPERPPRA